MGHRPKVWAAAHFLLNSGEWGGKKKMHQRLLILGLMIFGLLVSRARADTLILLNTQDTQIDVSGQNTNVGKQANGNADLGGGTGNRRILSQWDLSAIPAGSTITNAFVKFYRNSSTDDPTGDAFSAYRLTRAWTEGNGMSNGGYPAGITPNGATWLQSAKESNTNWTTAGGDYATSSRVQFTGVAQPDANVGGVVVAMNFNVTSMVSGWFSGADPNYGLIVISDETVYQRHAMRMRDWNFPDDGADRPPLPSYPASPTTQGGTYAPQLWVEYTAPVPEPRTIGLLAAGLGLTACVCVRRRR